LEDDETIVASNCSKKRTHSDENVIKNMEVEVINNATRVTSKPKLNKAIGDTGTTGNFVLPGAPVDDIKVATKPIEIEMPNGIIEKSTHTCYLRIPGLPKELREAHIVPGLSHSSLISIKKLCKGGCVVIFKDEICEVYYRGALALTGRDTGPGGAMGPPH